MKKIYRSFKSCLRDNIPCIKKTYPYSDKARTFNFGNKFNKYQSSKIFPSNFIKTSKFKLINKYFY